MDEFIIFFIVAAIALVGALLVYGILMLCVPKRGEMEEIK